MSELVVRIDFMVHRFSVGRPGEGFGTHTNSSDAVDDQLTHEVLMASTVSGATAAATKTPAVS